jgi:hypothetical protein
MNNSVEICGVGQGCIEEVIYACTCGNPVVFLCAKCVISHLSEPVGHTFISLEQARELVKDTKSNRKFTKTLSEYAILKASIQNYIGSLDTYKEDLIRTKNEIITLIEQEFQAKYELLCDNQASAVAKLEIIKKRMSTFTTGCDKVLRDYDNKGLKGVIDGYIHSFEIRTDELQDAISKMFLISHYDRIYYTRNNSSEILAYDHGSNKIEGYELGNIITHKFNYSSTCILPDGNVMIVGRYDPNHGDTYRFNPISRHCTKLNSLNFNRSLVGLYCHDKYLYAFGGYRNSNKAERMEWTGDSWDVLPDMKEARYHQGIVYMNDRIYQIGGYGTSSIEYFDILGYSFKLVKNRHVQDGYFNTVMNHDRIYIISKTQIKILTHHLNVDQSIPISFSKTVDSLNNQVIKGNKVYFHSYSSGMLYLFNAQDRSLTEIMSSTSA